MAARVIDLDRKPERRGQWLRWALSGPQSAGKTFTALLMAEQLGARTLVIDTERAGPETGSAELFAERFPTFVPFLWDPPYNPEDLAETIRQYSARFETVIVDSASHFWEDAGGTRAIVDEAAARLGGNTWAGWSEGTPVQKAMVEAIQAARCHIIFCMRSKVEWAQLPGKGGKLQPTAVGTAPIQRPGFEYEFALGTFLDQQHRLTVTKSRVDAGGFLLQVGDEFAPVRGESGPELNPEFLRNVVGWLGSATEQARQADPDTVARIRELLGGVEDPDRRKGLKVAYVERFGQPDRLMSDREGDALRWVEAQLGIDSDPQNQPRPEDAGDEDGPIDEPAPLAEEAAAKKAGAKKAGAKPRKATTPAPVAHTEPEPDPPADTAQDDEGAQEGVQGPMAADVVKREQGALTGMLLRVTPEWAAKLEGALTDEGLWPIGNLKNRAALEKAADVMFPILKEAQEAGAMTKKAAGE